MIPVLTRIMMARASDVSGVERKLWLARQSLLQMRHETSLERRIAYLEFEVEEAQKEVDEANRIAREALDLLKNAVVVGPAPNGKGVVFIDSKGLVKLEGAVEFVTRKVP